MDISCPSCAEPWDTVHLCCNAIYDTDLYDIDEELCTDFAGVLTDVYLKAFEQAGWLFAGTHVHTFISCPCCKEKVLRPDSTLRIKTRQLLAELMGDDIDGFISFSKDIDAIQNARHS